ncbi:hypothetical protein [Streptomyces sp. NPDC056323]|uniref:hypothetical protein n=1 Tax=Streptomyces sp. NPDC056323 TaxID=3345784 RepID=UPI0035E3A21E
MASYRPRQERGALVGRELASAVIGAIEEWFERGGDITPGPLSAEAPHLGETRPGARDAVWTLEAGQVAELERLGMV